MSNVTQFYPVTRARKVYSDTLETIERVFFGAGINASRIDLVRCENKSNNRVLFHPTIDKKQIFDEPMTIEHVLSFIKGAEAMKHAITLKGSVEGLFAIPPGHIQAGRVDRFESSSGRDVVQVGYARPSPVQMAAKTKDLSNTTQTPAPATPRRFKGNTTGSTATQRLPSGRLVRKPR